MHAETIYKGATRPAMKLGIPLVPLVVVFGAGMLTIIWVGPFLTWWIVPVVIAAVLPLLGWMRLATRKDDQRFAQLLIAGKLWLRDRNHGFWQSRSYAPYLYRQSIYRQSICGQTIHRESNDAWHR